MGIVETSRWGGYNKNGESKYEFGLFPTKTFMKETFKFINGRKEFECGMCKQKFGSGTVYMGIYPMLCFNCAVEKQKFIIEELKNWIKLAEDNIKTYEKNKNKWTKKAILGKLKQ